MTAPRFAAALVILLLIAMPVSAQQHDLEVDVTLTAEKRLDMRSAALELPEDLGCGNNDQTTVKTSLRGLTFVDGQAALGCMTASIPFWTYPNSQTFTIDFGASLQAYQGTGPSALGGSSYLANLTLLKGGSEETLFDGQIFTPSREVNSDIRKPLSPEGAAVTHPVTAKWSLADLGYSAIEKLPVGSEALDGSDLGASATPTLLIHITDPVIRFENVRLIPTLHQDHVASTRTEHINQARVTAQVSGAFDIVDISFKIAAEWEFVNVELDDGSLLDRRFVLFEPTDNGESLRVFFKPEVLSYFGGGNYTAIFELRTPMTPSPLMVPFVIGFAVGPAILGGYATGAALRFSAQAVGRYKVTARNLRLTLYLVWMLYAALVLYLLFGGLWNLAASWPITAESALIHGAFVVVAIGFILLGFYWRRQLDVMMRGELAEKERHNRDLQRSNQELEQFAYVASHDLQEPLRTVARFTQLLERRYAAQLDDDAREFMAYSVDGAKRMQALIDDLLTFSRVDSRGKPLAPVILDDVLERVRLGLAATIDETGAKITWDALPAVMGDASQLAQLLQNLLSNALKFRDGKQKPKVHVSARRVDNQWEIAVQDNGIGIESEYLERIFVVFQRLHARDEYDGTGIGLAVCKKIVERHGGHIWVESTPGKGSTFKFTLRDASGMET